ncbi:ScyD/ScyE family protein [Paracoccus actinidiae]|uniref:ScyD/ScyE family protein n=1 Tax=Paracoccus actinidiae TaxID=3064531 RepID=UPI0027D2D97D|nr:ScyD/ScyE family protein [Paracoccus sp. M09]
MEGLANPRGLSFGPDGWLYAAEAGTGGDGPSILSGDGQTVFFGLSGGVTRYRSGVQEAVIDGLPSLAPAGGFGATGAHDLAFLNGVLHVVMGFGANPALRANLAGAPGSELLGQVVSVSGNTVSAVADLAAFELADGPDNEPNSNPFSVVALANSLVVTDAGGNDVLTVSQDGTIALKAVLPQGSYQPVPTGATVGPNGDILVGQLTGFPFPVGGANVFAIDGAGMIDVFAAGFTNLIDVAFGNGKLYALEFDSDSLIGPNTTGSLFEVGKDGVKRLVYGALNSPTGLAIGTNGRIFVAESGVSPTDGRVIELAPVPLPASLPLLAGGMAFAAAVGSRKSRKRG